MTGRGAGYCAGYTVPGYMNPVGGRGLGGWGRGRGGGRGWRNPFYWTGPAGWPWAGMGWPAFGAVAAPVVPSAAAVAATVGTEQQLGALRAQAKYFEDALDGIRTRIEELQAQDKKG